VKDKWLSGVVLVLAIFVVMWNLYKGITVQEVGLPGLTIKFGTAAHGPAPTRGTEITGSWSYKLVSDVSHEPMLGALDLTADGSLVSGVMDNPDPERSGERSPVQGTYAADVLTLRRDTNRQGIVQEYRLARSKDGFTGTFKNVGQIEGRYKDSGQFSIHR